MKTTGVRVESALPAGWLPDGASAHVFAHRCDNDVQWEAVIPEFTVAGMGLSLEAAVANAIELLDDYLVLCANDGLSFQQASRPLGRELRLAVVAELVDVFITSVWRTPSIFKARGRSKDRQQSHARFKVPLNLVGVS